MKEIPLTQDKVALVDDEDYERVNQFKWCVHRKKGRWYGITNIGHGRGKQSSVLMHRFILNTPSGKQIDHWDLNGLNNQKCNLREATSSQNNMNKRRLPNNKTGYKGVSRLKGKYIRAQINVDGKRVSIGYFPDLISAAIAYDEIAKKVYGEFARLNFPEEKKAA